jgi:hypothetical protein
MTMACITRFTNDAGSRYRQAPKDAAHLSENVIDRLSPGTSGYKR